MEPTARNSDCQFWSVFSQKLGGRYVVRPAQRLLMVVELVRVVLRGCR